MSFHKALSLFCLYACINLKSICLHISYDGKPVIGFAKISDIVGLSDKEAKA